jgi:hypothetical protein
MQQSAVRGPRGLDHLRFLARTFDNYVLTARELQRRYGDVVHVRLPHRGVHFFDPRHVEHVCCSSR